MTLLCALPTMFDAAGEVDVREQQRLLDWLEPSVDGAFVAGTTGEFVALRHDERVTLTRVVLDAWGPERTIAHVGAAHTTAAVHLVRDLRDAGVTRFAAITPYFLPTTTAAVTAHYGRIREAAGDADLFAYLFPERTGVHVDVEQLVDVAASAGLAGVKLSGSASDLVEDVVAALPASAQVYSGADAQMQRVLAAGGAGVVSGCSSAFPEVFAALSRALVTGDATTVAAAQADVDAAAAALAGSIARIKEVTAARGFGSGAMRMAPDATPGGSELQALATSDRVA